MTATPWHTTGPFFPPAFIGPADGDLTVGRDGEPVEGERISVAGRIVDGEGQPVVNVIVELWQADASGRFSSGTDRFKGWGRVWTDREGSYRFLTVKPGAYRAAGDWTRPPHLSLRLLGSGLMRPLVTEAFFPGEPANPADRQLAAIGDPAARERLLLVPDAVPGRYRFDIVLRGEQETPFLKA